MSCSSVTRVNQVKALVARLIVRRPRRDREAVASFRNDDRPELTLTVDRRPSTPDDETTNNNNEQHSDTDRRTKRHRSIGAVCVCGWVGA